MNRLPTGGMIDRATPLKFTFDGQNMMGHPGDTLASALLANGQHLVARSLKYHRPRGILSAGLEEPSALVTVTDAHGSTPNLKVTEVPLSDGMCVTSQNNFPSLTNDWGAMRSRAGKMLSAGFYYKTFIWPRDGWHTHFAPRIRQTAGHGTVDMTPDTASYDKRNRWCDILVIGSGPAGLSAAVTAAQSGATTLIVEQEHCLGGSLMAHSGDIQGLSASDWAEDAEAALRQLSNVTVMANTLVFGQYDHGLVQAVETLPVGRNSKAILWKIRARRVILAAGAIERPLVFRGNDRPGIMLAGAVRSYIRRFAVAPGSRAVVAVANPNERFETVAALCDAGIAVATEIEAGDTLISASGRLHLTAVKWRDARGRTHRTKCDLMAMSAGWMPTAHLFAQMGERLQFDAHSQAFLPPKTNGPVRLVGGARGVLATAECVVDGKTAAHEAMAELLMHKSLNLPHPDPAKLTVEKIKTRNRKAFVDFQNDVTCDDLALALREGYRDIELTKRYTTLGMGTDQGKTSWTNGVIELAAISGRDSAEIGHTTYRPPYSPVSIGALVGAETEEHMTPTRRTPFHLGFEKLGCVFQTSGDWLYARYFPQSGEDMTTAINRECRSVRKSLGCVDMSTLGKIDVQGPDAHEFLSRLYCNNIAAFKPGRLRYGLMLREDGYVYDDGTIAQLGDAHFLVTTTTAHSGSVWRYMTKAATLDWPDLDVTLTSVSDHWASLAIAGPRARDLLQALSPNFDASREAFPFASVREGDLDGMPARVFSISFSGELSYEINTPAGYANTLLASVMAHGARWDITPYGLETLDVLRIEKGHISVGSEIDGRRTPDDLGLGGMVSSKKDFVGRAMLQRPNLQAGGREQLVGLVSADGQATIPYGAILSDQPLDDEGRAPACGQLTAAIYGPALGHSIALALLADGRNRIGESLYAHSPVAGQSVQVRVTPPCFIDPEGQRIRG